MTAQHDTSLNAYEQALVHQLREEANNVKDCFTRYSFQTLTIGAAALGLVFRYIWDVPLVGFAGAFVVLAAVAVARIGVYKFSTANRQLGYELHLYRTLPFKDHDDGWQKHMRSIGWEEAMRAWRVIQATVFEELYENHKPLLQSIRTNGTIGFIFRPFSLKKQYKDLDYKWFDPSSSINEYNNSTQSKIHAAYHPGTYLTKMLLILYLLSGAGIASMIIMDFRLWKDGNTIEIITAILFTIMTILMFIVSLTHLEARRKLLENGLLSIHSCAIMWQAVVVGHFRAVETQKNKEDEMYRKYTEFLAGEAVDLSGNIDGVHRWIIAKQNNHGQEASAL